MDFPPDPKSGFLYNLICISSQMRSRFVLKRERGCILCDISSPSLLCSALYGATSFNRQQTRSKSARQPGWLAGFHFLVPEIILITIFTFWSQKYFWSPFSQFCHHIYFFAKVCEVALCTRYFPESALRLLFIERYTLHVATILLNFYISYFYPGLSPK